MPKIRKSSDEPIMITRSGSRSPSQRPITTPTVPASMIPMVAPNHTSTGLP